MDTIEVDNLRPYRHVLLMVHELHKMGYQRLRIAPGMAPSGLYWRCTIAPASSISREHGARLVSGEFVARYSSGQGTAYFGWEDADRESPRALAEQFLERFSSLAQRGSGRDWAYAGWYLEMLRLTEPGALPIAYADYPLPCDYLPTVGAEPLAPIPLPPPGEAEQG